MDYQKKYLKYKLKYLNVKNIVKHGGTFSQQETRRIAELQSIADHEQDKKLIKVIDDEKLYQDIPEYNLENPTLPHKPAGSGLSDMNIDLTLAGQPVESLNVPISPEKIITRSPNNPGDTSTEISGIESPTKFQP
jgi:hypothetical protein